MELNDTFLFFYLQTYIHLKWANSRYWGRSHLEVATLNHHNVSEDAGRDQDSCPRLSKVDIAQLEIWIPQEFSHEAETTVTGKCAFQRSSQMDYSSVIKDKPEASVHQSTSVWWQTGNHRQRRASQLQAAVRQQLGFGQQNQLRSQLWLWGFRRETDFLLVRKWRFLHGGTVGDLDERRDSSAALPKTPAVGVGIHHLGLPEFFAAGGASLRRDPAALGAEAWPAMPHAASQWSPGCSGWCTFPRGGIWRHRVGWSTSNDHLHQRHHGETQGSSAHARQHPGYGKPCIYFILGHKLLLCSQPLQQFVLVRLLNGNATYFAVTSGILHFLTNLLPFFDHCRFCKVYYYFFISSSIYNYCIMRSNYLLLISK